ncbi:UDP-2,4-diacetamido-2,4,6-trideoxy-beta-L-altropyranose hydrolase [Janthinobacterium sp.]|uniref:UDP-2,4-diacetamido-2,4, 6-trideoxy-beta-L-altropyranose hydrolase n=1 Tax=Janthinobacterium sp. TaxID=1871054 RepID=UPI00293D545E|nr:UDP-2,4-diacetamido-2,4,6-trideoxy-beta-L-altropyranose hydrolase [Janthinobacterium sp.]
MSGVVFRVDASLASGSGHVMRCLTLATALRAGGAAVSFVCRVHPGHLCGLIEERGFAVRRLAAPDPAFVPAGGPYAAWLGAAPAEDAAQTLAALDGRPDWLVVDHYAIDAAWEGALRGAVGRILALDDLAERRHDCDILLDQNMVAGMDGRYAGLLPPGCATLLGPDYALLQPEYAEWRARRAPPRQPPRRLFAFFGGVDPADLSGKTLQAFLALGRAGLELDLVLPTQYPQEALRARAAGHANVRLHSGLPSLAPLMARADLALGACGATSWERLALRLPALVVLAAENPRAGALEQQRRGLAFLLGTAAELDAGAILAALRRVYAEGVAALVPGALEATVDAGGVQRVLLRMAARERQ